jgi:amidase
MPPRTKAKQIKSWQEIAQKAQEYRDASVAQSYSDIAELPNNPPNNVFGLLRQNLTQEEIHITEMLAEDLLAALAAGQLTATTVTRAFLRRASLAQRLVSLEH